MADRTRNESGQGRQKMAYGSRRKRQDTRYMTKCDVTGELIPVDEAVHFGGRVVSKKGRKILLERAYLVDDKGVIPDARTSADPWTRPSLTRRFLALLLDALFLAVGMFVLMIVAVVMGRVMRLEFPFLAESASNNALGGLLFFLYFAAFQVMWGRTPGKAICGCRIVDLTGNPITPWAGFLRAFWSYGAGALIVCVYFSFPRITYQFARLAYYYEILDILIECAVYEPAQLDTFIYRDGRIAIQNDIDLISRQ